MWESQSLIAGDLDEYVRAISDATGTLSSTVGRFLAPGKSYPMDYTVFKVGVLTLGLLLIVELARHKLDHCAQKRPFFKTVLDTFTSELATLGIVEFGIFVLHKYWKDMNLVQEALFAKVHFMFFYTAILNAIQSVFLAVLTIRLSSRMWVKTEHLELSHYIAIREEFEQARKRLRKDCILSSSLHASKSEEFSVDVFSSDLLAEDTWSWARLWKIAGRWFKHPILMKRFGNLVTQVRFHELRVQFIAANRLPPKFKVSEYLQSSELAVLCRLVHVSSFAWLALMGAVNLVYFLMSVVTMINKYKVGLALQCIFLGSCGLFILVSVLIIQKMKWIFSRVMHNKLIATRASSFADISTHSVTGPKPSVPDSAARELRENQLNLFWLSDPNLVPGAIQLMQFLYALFAAILLVFWKDVDTYSSIGLDGAHLSAICAASWVVFLVLSSQAIPRFTLCTSLGQLVDKETLRECLAKYKLEEAQRNRLREIRAAQAEDELQILERTKKEQVQRKRGDREPVMSRSRSKNALGDKGESYSDSEESHFSMLNKLVLQPTTQLPKLADAERNSRRSTRRKKTSRSQSEGVTAMRDMANDRGSLASKSWKTATDVSATTNIRSSAGERITLDDMSYTTNLRSSAGERRRLNKSVSADVALMRNSSTHALSTPQSSFDNDTGSKTKIPRSSSNLSIPSLNPVLEEIPSRNEPLAQNTMILSSPARVKQNEKTAVSDIVPFSNTDKLTVGTPDRITKVEHDSGSLTDRMRAYLLSGHYRQLSLVCGTLFCFFTVGVRMETLLIESGTLKYNPSVIELPGNLAFWFQVTWLSMFVVVSAVTVGLFVPLSAVGRIDMCIAGLSDIALSGTCLALLLVAEAQRTTGTFGSQERTVDGVGKIEPITSIIALRAFRFLWGKFVEKRLCTSSASNRKSATKQKHHGDHSDLQTVKATAADLWRRAVVQNPDIAAEYGEFSSELLQAMLGIPIVKPSRPMRSGMSSLTKAAHGRFAVQLESRFTHLSPAVQAIIFSGRVGKPMKAVVGDYLEDVLSSDDEGEQMGRKKNKVLAFEVDVERLQVEKEHDEWGNDEMGMLVDPNASLIRPMRRCERSLPPMLREWVVVDVVLTEYELVVFAVTEGGGVTPNESDSESHVTPKSTEPKSLFGRIFGSSIRGKDEYDVGMGVDIDSGDNPSLEDFSASELRKALKATGGGKKLRLRDVAFGRKIIGHFDLRAVNMSLVERQLPIPNKKAQLDIDVWRAGDAIEFWEDGSYVNNLHSEHFMSSLQRRWELVEEDRLRIECDQETLYLRFISDLTESELITGKKKTGESTIEKNNAIVFCQTLGKICGTQQLNPNLTILAEGFEGGENLNDYVEIVPRRTHNDLPHASAHDNGSWGFGRLLHTGSGKNHHRLLWGSDSNAAAHAANRVATPKIPEVDEDIA